MKKIKLNRGKTWDQWLVVIFLLFIVSFFHGSSLNKYPKGIHAWANMDRIALARGFEQNGLNIFKAHNYILNHQYPSFWSIPSESTRTAVEFPIHDYIPALFMKISGQHGPEIFHLYILIMSFLGLFYLYKWALLLTEDKLKSFFVLLFAAFAPNYIYYQGGFIPTIPSISLVIFALYNYARFYLSDQRKYWYYLLVFCTIAILARSTYAIPFLAILGFEGIRTLRRKKEWKYKLLSICVSFGLIALSLKYNAYVRQNFGSDFLSELLPSNSWAEVKHVMQVMFESWRFSYLTYKHYLVLLVLVCLVPFVLLFFRKHWITEFKFWWGLLGIWFLGVLAFWFVMNQQFIFHDYYFLDILYLPVVLFVILSLSALPKKFELIQHVCLMLLSIVFGYFAFIETRNFQEDRNLVNDWDTISGTVMNFEDSEKWLDELGIPKSAKIMVMHAYGPNIPFVLMNRTGYACKEYHEVNEFENALNWNWDYVVFQKPFFHRDVYEIYPNILDQVEPVAHNAKLILCKRKTTKKQQNLIEFLGFNKNLFRYNTNFSKKPKFATGFKFGENKVIIPPEEQFGFAMDLTPYFKNQSSLLLKAKVSFKMEHADKMPLIVAINDGDKLVYYMGIEFESNADSLTTQESFIVIPAYKLTKPQFTSYFFNPNKNTIELYKLDLELLTDSNK